MILSFYNQKTARCDMWINRKYGRFTWTPSISELFHFHIKVWENHGNLWILCSVYQIKCPFEKKNPNFEMLDLPLYSHLNVHAVSRWPCNQHSQLWIKLSWVQIHWRRNSANNCKVLHSIEPSTGPIWLIYVEREVKHQLIIITTLVHGSIAYFLPYSIP